MSLKHMKVLLLPFAILSFFPGCQESVFRSLQKTDQLFVYEGLPHPIRENPSFEKEKHRKDVTQIDGHWFYQPKVEASGEIHDDLMKLLLDENCFHILNSNLPAKDCGPFHPDYAIMWESDGVKNYLLICYTCDEGKLIKEGKVVIYDLESSKKNYLKDILDNFQFNRPKKNI